jgi:hypothetical protein
LRNSYSVAGMTQIIRVPQYSALAIQNGASITAPAWNGTTGGVVAVFVQGAVTLVGGNIDVSGTGFRGGAADVGAQPAGTAVSSYRSINQPDGGEKGEGIAGYESVLPNGYYGRGAPANGGGGGNSNRSAGGGGANGDNGNTWTGEGVMDAKAFGATAWMIDPDYISNNNQLTNSSGGGRGGYSSAVSAQDPRSVPPGNSAWGGNFREEVGGMGGHPVANNPAGQLFLGGGGGAGSEVTATGSGSNGGSGGGLVFLIARDISGSGNILANGAAGAVSRGNDDGAGGGGAGGTIVVSASRSLSGIAIAANGGVGGQSTSNNPDSQGPGGGGGGGYVATAGGSVTVSALAGLGGTSTSSSMTAFPYNGATGGAVGQPTVSANLPSGMLYPSCVVGDLAVSVTPMEATVAVGATAQFLVTVENAGPNPLTDITLREQSPWSGSAETWTCTASGGATCSAASGSGSLAGSVSIPAGGELSYTVSGTAAAGMPSGTLQYTLSATPPSGYGDPTPGDNTATGSINVLSGNIVDLSISITTSPAEPAFGEPVSYDFTIANQGPGTTDSQTVSFNLPMGASLQATLVGDSWSCATSTETVSCTRSAPLAPGQSSDLQLVLQPPTGAQSMQIAATVMASDGTDSDPSNNTALWNITIGESTIVATGGGLGCAVTRDPWQTSTNAVTLAGLVCVLLCLRVLTRRRRKGLV